jgi:sRNA-binding carbon storage regulator CsrA
MKQLNQTVAIDQETKEAVLLLKKNGVNISYEFRQFILAKAKEVKKQIQEENN